MLRSHTSKGRSAQNRRDSDEEIDSILADEGEIDMHCDYCGNHYIFNAMDIAEIRNNASPADPQVH